MSPPAVFAGPIFPQKYLSSSTRGILEKSVYRLRPVVLSNIHLYLYLSFSGEQYDFLKGKEDVLKEVFIVSGVEIENNRRNEEKEVEIGVKVTKADGEKCERCWSYSPSVGTIKLYPTLCSKCVANLS